MTASIGERSSPHHSREALSDMIQWDVATWKYGIGYWEERVGDIRGWRGLEIGSGDGGLSLFLGLKGCQVVCTDVCGPTDRARELHRQYGVSGLITYGSVDVAEIPFPDEHFELVILKSVLGALGNADGGLSAQRKAVSEIHRVLKRNGQFLFAENMRGSAMHVALRRHFVPWGREWHYFTEDEVTELLSGFGSLELAFRGCAATLGRREWQRSLLHGLDRVLVPLLPKELRYVVFGFAVK